MFSYFYRKVTNHALWGLFVLNNTEKFRSPFLLDSGLSHVRVFVGGVWGPLDVGLIDEALDTLLDHSDGGSEPGF